MATATQTLPKPRAALAYAGLVGAPLTLLLVILHEGQLLISPISLAAVPGTVKTPAQAGSSSLVILLAQIGLIIAVSRIVGSLMERMGQPRVIGEVLAGILLGPSLLGWVAPGFSSFLFPPTSFGVLNSFSQVGLVFFMFMVGLEVDIKELHRQGKVAVLVSHAGITAPMTLGALLALFVYRQLADPSVNFEGFALFMGVAMSITAFPVLARILAERKLLGTYMGNMAIACAAVDDITGWGVLAYVVGYIRSSHSALPVWASLAGLLAFVAVMVWGVRPLLRGMERDYLAQGALADHWRALLVVLVLISALVTEVLGLHLLFGAFLAGLIMPKARGFSSYMIDKFESATTLLLLPLFFAYTGLRTSIGLVRGPGMWGICVLIIVLAVAGKLGGTSIAARLLGVNWCESLGIGSLMNTRGLMELVVLNIGIDVKIISPELFSMMVVMAVVTTLMTGPLLNRFIRQGT